MTTAMQTLRQLGWRWHNNGAVLAVRMADGTSQEVFVPMANVHMCFAGEMGRVGCPLPQTVGAYSTAVGFFGAIKRAMRRVKRRIKKLIPKSIRRAAAKVHRLARKAVRFAHRVTKRAARFVRSPAGMAILAAVSTAVPVLAPASAAVTAAAHMVAKIDRGIEIAKQVKRGVLRPNKKQRKLMRQALIGKRAVDKVLDRAKRGDRGAQRFAGAMKQVLQAAR